MMRRSQLWPVIAMKALTLSCLVLTGLFATLPALAAKPVQTPSGLIYEEVRAGTGASPQATDRVRVHYVGRFADGSEFDSSVRRGQPAEFPLNRVIKCWTEAVPMMKVGGKAKLVCPPGIAYGETGGGGGKIPPNSTIFFEVELLDILKP